MTDRVIQSGLIIGKHQVKKSVQKMNESGYFNQVEIWGSDLGSNQLYKKNHPQRS